MDIKRITLFIGISFLISSAAFSQIKVACIGNSITYGARIDNREANCYPAQLQNMLGTDWLVSNFGKSGATLLKKGNHPYWEESLFTEAKEFNPDVVVIKLGTNDTKPGNIVHKDEFIQDYIDMIDEFKALPSSPDIFICLPVPAFPGNFRITDSVLVKYIIPDIKKVAQQTKVKLIDLHTPFLEDSVMFPDKIHPNAKGANKIASLISTRLLQWKTQQTNKHGLPSYKIQDHIKRILFLGNSITYQGDYITDIEAYLKVKYPQRSYEIINVGLPSETVSGLSELNHAGGKFPRPDLHERLERVLKKTTPDLVFATYGMNDGIYKSFDQERFDKFKEGNKWIHDIVTKHGASIVHITPSIYDERKGKAYANVLDLYSDWLLSCQYTDDWHVIDTHWPMKKSLEDERILDPSFIYAKDGVHPNEMGHFEIAKQILLYLGESEIADAVDIKSALASCDNGDRIFSLINKRQMIMKDAWLTDTKHTRPRMNIGLPIEDALQQYQDIEKEIQLQLSGHTDKTFPEYKVKEFTFEGRKAKIVFPTQKNDNGYWVWRARFWGHEPQVDKALLDKGFHLVYVDVSNMFGSNQAVDIWNKFYNYCTKEYKLNKKVILEGMSRGGLIVYNWAAQNTDKIYCIYADAPVCDIKSWPGGLYAGKGNSKSWDKCLAAHNLDEVSVLKYKGIPLYSSKAIAKAKIPVLHVYGDADNVVPPEENTELLAKTFRKNGGDIQLIKKEGVGHHPHCLEDPAPIIKFMMQSIAN